MQHPAHPVRIFRAAAPRRVLACLAALAFVAMAATAHAVQVTDEIGRKLNAPDRPQRILPLTPALTETVFALGLGHLAVASVTWADYPPEAKKLPSVGSYVSPSLERIIELAPDLVLASHDGNPPWVVERLERLGFAVYVVAANDPLKLPDTFVALGRVCGDEAAGRRLADELRGQFEAMARRMAGVTPRPTLMVIGSSPLVTAGDGSLSSALLRLAGARNIAQGLPGRWPTMSLEKVIENQPEVVILSTMERGMDRERVMDYWLNLPGLKDRPGLRVVYIQSDVIDRAGPRMGVGLERLARLIHPELFAEDGR